MDDTYGLKLGLDDAEWVGIVDATAKIERLDKAGSVLARNFDRYGKAIKTSSQEIYSGNSRIALGFNAIAQGAEDLQYSVGGAMNNLAQAALLFGAGGAIATGLTFGGIAVNQLYTHWDQLMSAIGMAPEKIRTAAEELKALQEIAKGDRTGDQSYMLRTLTRQAGEQAATEGNLATYSTTASLVAQEASKSAKETLASLIPAGKTGDDVIKAIADARYNASVQGGGPAGQDAYEFHRQAAEVRVGAALGGNSSEMELLIHEIQASKSEMLAPLKEQLRLNKIGDEFDRITEESEIAARSMERARAESERLGEQFDRLVEAEERASKAAAEKQERADADATKRRVDAQERENADRLKSWQNSPEHQQAIASDAMQRYNEAEFAYATAGNPQMARMLRQQQAMARRFGGANTSASIMQRQMMERMGGGSEAIAQRERAQEVMREASMTFKEAVEKLAREGLQVTL